MADNNSQQEVNAELWGCLMDQLEGPTAPLFTGPYNDQVDCLVVRATPTDEDPDATELATPAAWVQEVLIADEATAASFASYDVQQLGAALTDFVTGSGLLQSPNSVQVLPESNWV